MSSWNESLVKVMNCNKTNVLLSSGVVWRSRGRGAVPGAGVRSAAGGPKGPPLLAPPVPQARAGGAGAVRFWRRRVRRQKHFSARKRRTRHPRARRESFGQCADRRLPWRRAALPCEARSGRGPVTRINASALPGKRPLVCGQLIVPRRSRASRPARLPWRHSRPPVRGRGPLVDGGKAAALDKP